MSETSPSKEGPILTVVGDLVALGPLRRDLLPLYQRWVNDLGTMRTLGLPPSPMTSEKDEEWYERQSKTEDDTPFTIYERETLRPIGNTGLHSIDHRNRTATFGILIGEPECRGKGYGTETTRLMLDYAFTALGLHNVMLQVFEFNAAGTAAHNSILEERTVDEIRVTPHGRHDHPEDDTVGAHYACLERPCACLEDFVFITYQDEYGEEREASYHYRRCNAGETR